jgi:hypothetical protein
MFITNRGSTRGKIITVRYVLPMENPQGEKSLQSDKICLLPMEDPQVGKSLQPDKICLLPIEDPQGKKSLQ